MAKVMQTYYHVIS